MHAEVASEPLLHGGVGRPKTRGQGAAVPGVPHRTAAESDAEAQGAADGSRGADPNIDPVADRAERDKSIKELYRRLQGVFPGFDPKKEPHTFGKAAAGQKAGAQTASNQASPTVQQAPQMPNMPAPPVNQGAM